MKGRNARGRESQLVVLSRDYPLEIISMITYKDRIYANFENNSMANGPYAYEKKEFKEMVSKLWGRWYKDIRLRETKQGNKFYQAMKGILGISKRNPVAYSTD